MGANAVTTVPVYTAGEVLTAADMNITNSGIPVFATTTTRDAAFGGTGEKVLAEGQFAYIEASDQTQYYSGSSWLALGGKLGQVVSASKTDTFTTASTSYVDVTGLSVSITPSSATSKVLVFAVLSATGDVGATFGSMQLVRDAVAINVGDTAGSRISNSATINLNDVVGIGSVISTFLDSPNTTSATTYKIQVRSNVAGTMFVNRSETDGNAADYPRSSSTITVMEILA